MITELWDLRSTHNGNAKKIYVTINHDGQSKTANLIYTICSNVINKTMSLGADSPITVDLDHNEQGTCVVTVEDADSKKETHKTLDLDAAQDS